MDFSPEECERFIKMVSEHPALYNPKDHNYKHQLIRDSIWMGIAQHVNRPPEVCKKTWRNLKDSYTRYKRRYKETGNIDKRSHSHTYSHMSFLEDIIPNKPRYDKPKRPKTKIEPRSTPDPIILGIEHIMFDKPIGIFDKRRNQYQPPN